MMHARPHTIGESHVMNTTFSMHPRRPQLITFFVFCIFRNSKAEVRIKLHGSIYVVTKAIEMVNPQWFDTTIKLIFLMDWRQPFHFMVKFKWDTNIVGSEKCSTLVWAVHP